jgi:uncharacterized membrane protein YphA (DoxX/SURF4 family)
VENLPNIGRVFFGVAIAVMGLQTIVDCAFPYMLIPPQPSWRLDIPIVTYFFGALLTAAGLCIILNRQTRPASLFLGGLLALVFAFYYLPYQFVATDFMNLHSWEDAEKELDLACGAFIVAGFFVRGSSLLFALTMITYGIFHFQLAAGVAEYIPSWIPVRLFWAYLAGAALIASGVAIITRIKVELAAFLLGTMILIWFLILHMPRVITSTPADLSSEISSACLALAYCGIAYMLIKR